MKSRPLTLIKITAFSLLARYTEQQNKLSVCASETIVGFGLIDLKSIEVSILKGRSASLWWCCQSCQTLGHSVLLSYFLLMFSMSSKNLWCRDFWVVPSKFGKSLWLNKLSTTCFNVTPAIVSSCKTHGKPSQSEMSFFTYSNLFSTNALSEIESKQPASSFFRDFFPFASCESASVSGRFGVKKLSSAVYCNV